MANFNIRQKIREAAEGGDPFAQFKIAIDFDYGNDGERDFEKAAFWYTKAASQGHDAAQGNLLTQDVVGQAHLKQPEEALPAARRRRICDRTLRLFNSYNSGDEPTA